MLRFPLDLYWNFPKGRSNQNLDASLNRARLYFTESQLPRTQHLLLLW